jgi:hypothetical protein
VILKSLERSVPDNLDRLQIGQMLTFEVYLDDARYQVSSLYLIAAESDEAAWGLAQEMWRESRHHRGVELRRDGVRLRGAGTMARACPSPSDLPEFPEV